MPPIIYALPGDVLVLMMTLGQLSPADILNFVLASKACQAAIESVSEPLWRAIARQRYHNHNRIDTNGIGVRDMELPELTSALEQAIAAQQTISSCYDHVKTWKEFVKIKHNLRKAWEYGIPERRRMVLLSELQDLEWPCVTYIRVCPKHRLILAAADSWIGGQADCRILAQNWSTGPMPSPHAQTLVTYDTVKAFQCVNDLLIYTDNDCSDREGFTVEVRKLSHLPGSTKLGFDNAFSFELPQEVYAYKARFPFLLLLLGCNEEQIDEDQEKDGQTDDRPADADAPQLRMYDLRDGRLLEQHYVGVEGREQDSFKQYAVVDFDEDHIVVTSLRHPLSLVERHSGTVMNLMSSFMRVKNQGTRHLAHSLDGNHLIVGFCNGQILWFRNWRHWSSMSGPAKRNSLVRLEVHGVGDRIDNIIVNGNRVIFGLYKLYTFELFEWTNVKDFASRPPKIRVIYGPDGNIDDDYTFDADSTAIYVSASKTEPVPGRVMRPSERQVRLVWDSEYGEMCDAQIETLLEYDVIPVEAEHAGHSTKNCIIAYDFARARRPETD